MDPIGDHRVGPTVGDGNRLGEAVSEADVRESELLGRPAGLGEHLGGHVDADDLAGAADLAGGDEGVESRAGAHVDHPLTWRQWPQRERIPHAGERLDGLVGERVDDGLVVAEAGGEGTAGVEMVLCVRGERDVAVLVPHLLAQGEGVDQQILHHRLSLPV
jgi:hypothetical protein